MKKKIYVSLLMVATLVFTGCMDENDEPNTSNYTITSSESVGETNTTIYKLKTKYSSVLTTNNTFVQITTDEVFEGVVCANDEGGNLYQTLIIRSIDTTQTASSDAYDQCISIGIKNTFISPYFKLGQRVKINLNGLYIGNYSKVPKIGQPYYTSAGNLRLGPMLLEMCATNIELIGTPNVNALELVPVDLTTTSGIAWLEDKSNMGIYHTPMLAKVSGKIAEAQGVQAQIAATGELSGDKEPLPKIFAPKALYDAGYGVDRTLNIEGSTQSLTIRTSTQNDCSYLRLPSDTRWYVGQLTYYSGWQLTFRSVDDIERYEELQ